MSSDRMRAKLVLLGRIAVAICLLCAFLVGCARATPTPEPVTISFAYPDLHTEYYQALVQKFSELYPHITIELEPKEWDMLGGVSAGEADVFVTSQFALNWLQEQGNILNLTPFIEQDELFDVDDFYPGTVGLYTREGDIWAIPAAVDIMVMYYNQDLLDRYGAPYPRIGWTWDDFLEVLMTVRDPGADVFGYAANLNLFDPLTFIYQHGGRIFDDLQNPTRTTFDDPLNIEALEWYVRLMYDLNVAPTPEQTREVFGSRGSLQTGVYSGQVALWTGMLSEQGGRLWPVEWDMRWGMAPLPRDVESATLTLVEGYFVSAQAPHPEACWNWIAFLSAQLPALQAPVRRSLAESEEYESRVGAQVAAVVRASIEDALLLSPKLAEFEDALDLFGQAFEAIYSERSTPEEAMSWAQQQSRFK